MAPVEPITVQYNGVNIMTYVANTYAVVDSIVYKMTNAVHRITAPYKVLGLAIKWGTNPSNGKVASLQLCYETFCSIFQLHHLDPIPSTLKSYFANPRVTIVGVSAKEDLLQLKQHYGLECSCHVHDLLPLADMVYGFKDHFTTQGMDRLAEEIFGMTIEKPDRITRSDWGIKYLTADQIKYATIDAYLSFFIGSNLLASRK